MPQSWLKNVAIVGAGGRSGQHITDALLAAGKHNVTAITRPDSTNSMPEGVHSIAKVDYNNHSSLVSALQGQDILIITMSHFAASDSQKRLIDAAVDAGVEWVIPNEWAPDLTRQQVVKDVQIGERLLEMRRYIEEVGGGKLKYIGVACSFWYEFSLAGDEVRYGFDFPKKKVTFFDDGNSKINTTTFAQVGKAVAQLLSLKVAPDGDDEKSPTLSMFVNQSVYISSFFVSQSDMFESVLRVTGDREEDWTVSHEGSKERYERGLAMSKKGEIPGFIIVLYTRIFYPDGSGDYNDKLANDLLDLPKEDLDAVTKAAVEIALSGGSVARVT